jgi:hypothetical protein
MNKRGKDKDISNYNFFPKNRRGSHVGVIISFIIFVTFIIFLLIVAKPSITKQDNKNNIFESIEMKVIERTSASLTVATVSLEPGSTTNCVHLTDLVSYLSMEENIIVRDSSGDTVDYYINGNSLEINRDNLEDNFFKIYYSSEPGFGIDQGTPQASCDETIYSIGLTKTEEYTFQDKMADLIDYDYEDLKEEFDIPKGVDFGYGLVLSDGTKIPPNEEELSTNIYIRETPVEYVSLSGEILEGYIRVRIW